MGSCRVNTIGDKAGCLPCCLTMYIRPRSVMQCVIVDVGHAKGRCVALHGGGAALSAECVRLCGILTFHRYMYDTVSKYTHTHTQRHLAVLHSQQCVQEWSCWSACSSSCWHMLLADSRYTCAVVALFRLWPPV